MKNLSDLHHCYLFAGRKKFELDLDNPEDNPHNLFAFKVDRIVCTAEDILCDAIVVFLPVFDARDAASKLVKLEVNDDGSSFLIDMPKTPLYLLDQVKAIHGLEDKDTCIMTMLQHGETATALHKDKNRRILKVEAELPDGMTVNTTRFNEMKGKKKPGNERKVKNNFRLIKVCIGKTSGGDEIFQDVPFFYWKFVVEGSERPIDIDEEEEEEEDIVSQAVSRMSKLKMNVPDTSMSS